jgi:N-acetylneuraminate synthase/N,N'-diacetyllegionaminate synthase
MKIGRLPIGSNSDPYFIAEAGVNHNGDVDLAEELIDVAASAGADAVKFQTFSTERLVSEHAETADYQEEQTDFKSQREMLRQYELNHGDYKRLIEHSNEQNITFLSTPFSPESADLLKDLDIPAIKLGSGELDNHPLLEHVAGFGRPMIVSTGMGTMEEVHEAYDVITSVDSEADVVFLHCTSAYPCDISEVNLRVMQKMDDELPTPVGYSDHTTLTETPSFAVAAGAAVIEKHFTIDRSLPGPDHRASLEPDELQRAISLVEIGSTLPGDDKKMPTPTERKNMDKSRKGLHATTDIPAGKRITDDHVNILRPATGLSPRRYDGVVGARAATGIAAGDPITAADVEGINERDN